MFIKVYICHGFFFSFEFLQIFFKHVFFKFAENFDGEKVNI